MSDIVLDYTAPIAPATLKAAGVVGVCRYLSWMYRWGGATHSYPNPKIIQKPEYDALRAGGIAVTLNWEYDAQDWLSGAAGGQAHGAEAVSQAKALGYPAGSVIVGSADFNMSGAQWTASGKAYATAFAKAIRDGGFRPGVYGPWNVLQWVSDAKIMDAFWQAGMSTSWSGGLNSNPWPGAHLRQRGYKTVGGQNTDWNEIRIPNWGATAPVPTPEEDDVRPFLAYTGDGDAQRFFICDLVTSVEVTRDDTAAIRAAIDGGQLADPFSKNRAGQSTLDWPVPNWSEAYGKLQAADTVTLDAAAVEALGAQAVAVFASTLADWRAELDGIKAAVEVQLSPTERDSLPPTP